jgi:hypothetical protein
VTIGGMRPGASGIQVRDKRVKVVQVSIVQVPATIAHHCMESNCHTSYRTCLIDMFLLSSPIMQQPTMVIGPGQAGGYDL